MSTDDAAAREFADIAAKLQAADTDTASFDALARWLLSAVALVEQRYGRREAVPGKVLMRFLGVARHRARQLRGERREH